MSTPNVELRASLRLPPNTVIRARHLRRAMIEYHDWARRNVWYRRIPRNTFRLLGSAARQLPGLSRFGTWLRDAVADPVAHEARG
jgi:hypothetical protein